MAHMGGVQTFEQHALDGLGLTMDYGLPLPREAPSTIQPEVRVHYSRITDTPSLMPSVDRVNFMYLCMPC